MPPVDWKAIQSLAKARPGATPPLLGASNANPAVMAQLQNAAQQREEDRKPGCLFMAKNALNGGELSPYLAARIDQPKWLTGCRKLRNLVPLPQGGITRRPGFRSVRALSGDITASSAVFIPFIFGQGEERMLELVGTAGGSTLNVYTPDGGAIRLDALSLPYKMQHLADLSYAQSADVLYVAHSGYNPAKIMRYGDTDWRFGYLEFLPEISAPSILLARAVGDIPSGENSRTHYDYVVTAIDGEMGEESLASASARVNDASSRTERDESKCETKARASDSFVFIINHTRPRRPLPELAFEDAPPVVPSGLVSSVPLIERRARSLRRSSFLTASLSGSCAVSRAGAGSYCTGSGASYPPPNIEETTPPILPSVVFYFMAPLQETAMTTITFNTLAYSKTLRAAGFDEAQAEALANAQSSAFSEMLETSDLATKSDISRLDNRITQLEKQMAEMETRLVKSFHSALFGFTGVIIASVAVAVAILK